MGGDTALSIHLFLLFLRSHGELIRIEFMCTLMINAMYTTTMMIIWNFVGNARTMQSTKWKAKIRFTIETPRFRTRADIYEHFRPSIIPNYRQSVTTHKHTALQGPWSVFVRCLHIGTFHLWKPDADYYRSVTAFQPLDFYTILWRSTRIETQQSREHVWLKLSTLKCI